MLCCGVKGQLCGTWAQVKHCKCWGGVAWLHPFSDSTHKLVSGQKVWLHSLFMAIEREVSFDFDAHGNALTERGWPLTDLIVHRCTLLSGVLRDPRGMHAPSISPTPSGKQPPVLGSDVIFDQPPVSFTASIYLEGEGRESAAPAGLRNWSSSADLLISYDLIKIPTTCRLVPAQRFAKMHCLVLIKRP